MNMIQAARDTMELAQLSGMGLKTSAYPECDYNHLMDMLEKMEEEEFSEGKMGRWLGWMQCAVVCADIGLTLHHMKEINRRNS